jgi:Derlin-2/3
MSPEEWFRTLPVITKTYFTIAVATTVLVVAGALNPRQLYLDWPMITGQFHFWRLATNFCFFGGFGMPWVFSMYLLVTYFKNLESEYYAHGPAGTAEMSFMLVCGACVMFALSNLVDGMYFNGLPLVYMVLYVWARKDPYRVVSLWGFTFAAWKFPFIVAIVGVLMGNSPVTYLIGIFVGHLWHFLADVMPHTYNRTVIRTPQWMYNLFERTEVGSATRTWNSGRGHRLD